MIDPAFATLSDVAQASRAKGASPMERFLLFIRDSGREDIVAFHPDEPAARKALISYVRRQPHRTSQSHSINDDVAIKAYFGKQGAMYAIARVQQTRGPAR